MAVTKITYENKEAIQNDTSVANKGKVTDADMNEIKQTVNNNADELSTAQENIEELQEGQGTSNADITSLKNRVSTLENNVTSLGNNKVDKVEGKGLSTEDFTNEYKQKLDDLENYDDTEIKQDIEELQEGQGTSNADITQNKENIENLQEDNTQNKSDISDIKEEQETQNEKINTSITKNEVQDELISKLKSALINVETEEAKSLHVTDANKFGQLEVLGNQEQDGEPSPENEVPVICLGSNTDGSFKGSTEISKVNKNWFNTQKIDINNWQKRTPAFNIEYTGSNEMIFFRPNTNFSYRNSAKIEYPVIKGKTYTISYNAKIENSPSTSETILTLRAEEPEFTDAITNIKTVTATSNKIWLFVSLSSIADGGSAKAELSNIQIEMKDTATEYVEHQEKNYILPIQQEMLEGDYFIKETDGWKEVHNWTKIDSYNSESITTDYISTTGELTTGATIYYKLATPTKLACTEEQIAVLEELNNLDLFNGVNNIITTEDIALLKLKYVVNTKTYIDNKLNTINQQILEIIDQL